MVAATSVLAIVLLLGTAVIALATHNVQMTVENRSVLKAQLAAEGALDSAQYRLAKTAGGLVGNGNGGSFLSIKDLPGGLGNALCITVDVAGIPSPDLGNSNAGMCPAGDWESMGDDQKMLVRQQPLGVLKPNELISRIVVGVGRSGPASRPITRRMIMRLELKLDDLGRLSLIRRRGVAACKGAYDPDDAAAGCPQPPAPPTNATAGDSTFDPVEPTDPDPNAPAVPALTLAPHIDGTPEVGETLVAVPGQWRQLSADAVRSYQWFLCNGGVCSTQGADAASSTRQGPLTSSSWGRGSWRWVLRETVTNNPGKANEASAYAWSMATLGNQAHTGGDAYAVTTRSPRINGTAQATKTLTLDAGQWAVRGDQFKLLNLEDLGDGITRTWYRCPASGVASGGMTTPGAAADATCAALSGSGSTRTLTSADVGSRLRARVELRTCGFALLVCFDDAKNYVLTQATPVVRAAG
jgi:hypothetical protein